ncbi:hypothetical protein [Streptomyces sp. B93]|uniref:hypothetical protein n=1 Tax=Streptomyces sp. B93 TaxID=2824875 RepID=UPI001B37C1C2|nr:hypothetical protein [Streptomyces sp. B93]
MWLTLAVVALLAGVASAYEVRGALEREREFHAAPACASAPAEASRCLWEQDFTVRKADMHRGERNQSAQAELLLPSGKPWRVTFRNTEPVASQLEPGDEVVGLIWYGQVVELRDADGRSQQTSDGPVGWPEDRLGGAFACFSFGVIALAGALWSLFARGRRGHEQAASVVRWHGVGLGVATILVLWVASAGDWPLWAIPAAWGGLALVFLTSMVASATATVRRGLESEEERAESGRMEGLK